MKNQIIFCLQVIINKYYYHESKNKNLVLFVKSWKKKEKVRFINIYQFILLIR